MLFARINREEPERVCLIVKAAEALLDGRPVCYHFDGIGDGKDAYLANEAVDGTKTIGLADEAIASGVYGKVLVYGLKTNAQILGDSDFAANCGAVLNVASGSSGHLVMSESVGAATAMQPTFVYGHSASLTSSAALRAAGVYVRAL